MFAERTTRLRVTRWFAMTKPIGNEITALLLAWRRGDDMALEKLTPQVYRELHRAAKRCMRGERFGHSLQTTGLINELYLAGGSKTNWLAQPCSFLCAVCAADAAHTHR